MPSDRNGQGKIASDTTLPVAPEDPATVEEALASILRDRSLSRRLRAAAAHKNPPGEVAS